MARPNREKISTQGANQIGSGLFQAFEGLDSRLVPLPEGATSEPSPEKIERPLKKGRVVLRKETAHRGGKSVIVVDDFSPEIEDPYITALAKKIRAACGCGGAVRGRTIELQGEMWREFERSSKGKASKSLESPDHQKVPLLRFTLLARKILRNIEKGVDENRKFVTFHVPLGQGKP